MICMATVAALHDDASNAAARRNGQRDTKVGDLRQELGTTHQTLYREL
jgi:hypothetical protein